LTVRNAYVRAMAEAGARVIDRRGALRPDLVPRDVLALLERGDLETVNLMEQIAMNMGAHLAHLFPHLAVHEEAIRDPRLVTRMRLGGAVLLSAYGLDVFQEARAWTSDTARGWAAMAAGLVEGLSIVERLDVARPFADDYHFGVREWAWLGVRNHIRDHAEEAIECLKDWARSDSQNLRRFASEATRPIGVWSVHISELKQRPELAETLLELFHPEPSRYVRASLGNWLNDASRTRPDWVMTTCRRWESTYGTDVKDINRRGTRTIRRRGR
jgi:3-methyladenine DNA glycosylase AlkC